MIEGPVALLMGRAHGRAPSGIFSVPGKFCLLGARHCQSGRILLCRQVKHQWINVGRVGDKHMVLTLQNSGATSE